MNITIEQMAKIAGKGESANMRSALAGLEAHGAAAGLNEPHRLAHYLAQLCHESMGFVYDRELWGPTSAQKRYDTRTDLGNTAAADGDGYLYRGRGPIQITGRTNYSKFTTWAMQRDAAAPDFVTNPDAVTTDPWEGLGPIWYWDSGNPIGQSLNRYADDNNIEMVTRRINGGLNGYADRLKYYDRAALVLLGHGPTDMESFQAEAGLEVDGISGPKTRAAMHRRLLARIATQPEALIADPSDDDTGALKTMVHTDPAEATQGAVAAVIAALLRIFGKGTA